MVGRVEMLYTDITIDTYSGTFFHVFDPREEEIDIADIAHALSNLCRFTGQCDPFYSVAEHCCRVADYLPDKLKLAGLLHDAAEAYISDINGAYKKLLPLMVEADNQITSVIMRKFKVRENDHQIIKNADMVLRATERRDLMKNGHNNLWQSLSGFKPLGDVILPFSPKHAESLYLMKFSTLTHSEKYL
jgi:hypothetical protein